MALARLGQVDARAQAPQQRRAQVLLERRDAAR